MKRYAVTIIETHVYAKTVEVDAENVSMAKAAALNQVDDPPEGWRVKSADVETEVKVLPC